MACVLRLAERDKVETIGEVDFPLILSSMLKGLKPVLSGLSTLITVSFRVSSLFLKYSSLYSLCTKRVKNPSRFLSEKVELGR